MAVILTEKAAAEVQKTMQEQSLNATTALRIAVAGGGCSGLEYQLSFDEVYDEEKDSRSEQHGVAVLVDRKSALHLDGTVIDYYDGIEKRGFKIENPNAVRSCGCGKSFSS
ncbi:HesB/IscA family protein [Lignipirellula cremea]|uniref:Iron-sulfur cluster insertion protein ErpA n=1 Tax=Lignipirellula cremea TaxID=2528010 RepID=A0A518DZI3_9BACT|nr:iron-sulfur cluster assembly accessory protein [Lignipirellula cremea]QDU97248.1 Iron-sulfur cluster insertion protein ErpA [Lignipirellula cremea]